MAKLFYTNASAKEAVSTLESKVESLEADGVTAAAEIQRLNEENKTQSETISTLNTELADAAKAIDAMEKETAEAKESLATANESLATASAKLATFDAEVEKAAQAKFAGLGGAPIPESGNSDEPKDKFAGLTGLERAKAAHMASYTSKK